VCVGKKKASILAYTLRALCTSKKLCTRALCVAVCCSMLQRVDVCCSVLQCVAVCSRLKKNVLKRCCSCNSSSTTLCCSVLQCIAACCSVFQKKKTYSNGVALAILRRLPTPREPRSFHVCPIHILVCIYKLMYIYSMYT